MTSTGPAAVQQTDPEVAPAAERAGTACSVCPHPWEGHDALGRRFCTATRDVGWERGCICR
jgi:hypothetical protein